MQGIAAQGGEVMDCRSWSLFQFGHAWLTNGQFSATVFTDGLLSAHQFYPRVAFNSHGLMASYRSRGLWLANPKTHETGNRSWHTWDWSLNAQPL